MNKNIAILSLIAIVILAALGFLVMGKLPSSSNPQPSPSSKITTAPAPRTSEETKKTTITLTPSGFEPANITVKPGETVVWVNQSGADSAINSSPHPVHTDYPPLNLGLFSNGGNLSLTFTQPGTYKYHDHFNPQWFGSITVE